MKAHAALAGLLVLAAAVALGPARAQQAPGAGGGEAPPAKLKPPPRTLVLTFGRADKGEMAPVVQGAAEQTLLDLRFPLADESQIIAHYQLETLEQFLLLTPELARIAELKARYGVDLICVIQYSRRFQYEKDYFGAKSRFYKDDVRVKAIFSDTAEVVYSGGGEGPIEARQTGLEELTRGHVRRMAEKVLERWSYEAVGPSTYQVVALGFEPGPLRSFEAALRAHPRVREVVERGLGGPAVGEGNALIEVRFQGQVEELKAVLGSLQGPPVEVRSATANRVEVAPAAGGEQGNR